MSPEPDQNRHLGVVATSKRPCLFALKPVGQIQDDSENNRLGQAEENARCITENVLRETGQHRDYSGHHDSRDPNPRPNPVQKQIAGYLKEKVTEKENPEDQSILLAVDGQLSVHRQRRKPNVVAVELGNDEQQEHKGKDPDPHFLDSSCLDGRGTSGCFVAQSHLSVNGSKLNGCEGFWNSTVSKCIRQATHRILRPAPQTAE
jgi:hypothetical protein